MEQKIIFRNKLEELTTKAQRSGGVLKKDEIDAQLAQSLTPEQMELVYQYLSQCKITVEGWSQSVQSRLSGRRVLGETAQSLWSVEEAPAVLEGDEDGEDVLTALECYMEELERIEDPGTEVRTALLRRIAGGDQAAMRELAQSYLPMVADLVGEYEKDAAMPVEDLLQEGNIALWEAIAALDLESCGQSGAALTAQLMNAVNQHLEEAIKAELDESDSGQAIAGQANRLNDTLRMLEEELGHPASIEELSAFLEMETEKLESILSLTGGQLGQSE